MYLYYIEDVEGKDRARLCIIVNLLQRIGIRSHMIMIWGSVLVNYFFLMKSCVDLISNTSFQQIIQNNIDRHVPDNNNLYKTTNYTKRTVIYTRGINSWLCNLNSVIINIKFHNSFNFYVIFYSYYEFQSKWSCPKPMTESFNIKVIRCVDEFNWIEIENWKCEWYKLWIGVNFKMICHYRY